MPNLFQDLNKNQKLSTKKLPKIIVKTFFINKTNENYLNPTLIPKLFSCQLLNSPQVYLFINAFNNWDAHDYDNCQTCDN